MLNALLAAVLLLPAFDSLAAAPPLATRAQVEQWLGSELPSGSSPATVAQRLDAQGIAHGAPEPSGPTVVLRADFRRAGLAVRFSFLQNRLIGYAYAEPAATH
jgi:hypothetical protein